MKTAVLVLEGGAVAQAAPRAMRIEPSRMLAAIGLGAAAVLFLWWHSAPPVRGLGGWLTGAGEILGLLAGYGVIILVLLMARLPPVERGVGADRLARWHAMGGRYVVCIIVAHALLIIWGYAVSTHESLTSETATLLTSYPDVLMATVAAFVLLGVGIVSARAARRRLRYETWYYLHFYTYLAVALAFSHQFADGTAFIADTAARVCWSALYIAVAAALAWYRVALPLLAFGRHRFRVAGVKEETPGIFSVYVAGTRLRELATEPGQFFRWRFLARGQWWQSHPYSLSAMPSDELMRLTVRDVGDHTRTLRGLRPGTPVIAEGPYGALTPPPAGWLGGSRLQRRVLLLAGGVGITPLRAMFASMAASPGGATPRTPRGMSDEKSNISDVRAPVTLVYRASSWRDVVFRDELDAIAAAGGGDVHYLVGTRAELGSDPLSPAALRALVPGLPRMDVYLCAPSGMTTAAVAALTEAGVPRRHIHYESFEF